MMRSKRQYETWTAFYVRLTMEDDQLDGLPLLWKWKMTTVPKPGKLLASFDSNVVEVEVEVRSLMLRSSRPAIGKLQHELCDRHTMKTKLYANTAAFVSIGNALLGLANGDQAYQH